MMHANDYAIDYANVFICNQEPVNGVTKSVANLIQIKNGKIHTTFFSHASAPVLYLFSHHSNHDCVT